MVKKINYVLTFLAGFASCIFLFSILNNTEKPLGNLISNSQLETPSNWVKEEQIIVKDDMIIIKVDKASISNYAPTGSMTPVFDELSNGIRITPKSEESIQVGDIITFKEGSNLIVHRVIEKGTDDEGTYFITKGDSNNISDGKIRFSDVKYVTIGVLW